MLQEIVGLAPGGFVKPVQPCPALSSPGQAVACPINPSTGVVQNLLYLALGPLCALHNPTKEAHALQHNITAKSLLSTGGRPAYLSLSKHTRFILMATIGMFGVVLGLRLGPKYHRSELVAV